MTTHQLPEYLQSVNGHSPVGGSSMSRVLRCPGSVKASFGIPNSSSKYADEGTKAHAIAEQRLHARVAGKKLPEPTTDMERHADEYIEYIFRQAPDVKPAVLIEHAVDYTHLMPNGVGTADCVMIDEVNGWLHVFDYKYGQGVMVYAAENEQLLSYLAGVHTRTKDLYEYTDMMVHICQPRAGENGHWDSWPVTPERLAQFELQVRVAANLIVSDKAPLVPGEKQCLWCPRSGNCQAQFAAIEKDVLADFDDVSEPDIENLTNEQLAQFHAKMPLIRQILSDVDSEIHRRTEAGEMEGLFKMVRGRKGPRSWNGSASVDDVVEQIKKANLNIDWIKTNVYSDPQLLSPTQLEKKGLKLPDQFVTQSQGKLVYAPIDDPRPAVTSVEDDFDDVQDGDAGADSLQSVADMARPLVPPVSPSGLPAGSLMNQRLDAINRMKTARKAGWSQATVDSFKVN